MGLPFFTAIGTSIGGVVSYKQGEEVCSLCLWPSLLSPMNLSVGALMIR